ncbi:MAG: 4-(cytidine 5'-diphospho)-2-C-methyl-D-erythritol kinase [Deltaproteobacteria bacterium]|nr:4-(cytidine 5'-diphospho)-2-C-methyl-D-erythritol kinase [Deltaproteobacteria bacterium]
MCEGEKKGRNFTIKAPAKLNMRLKVTGRRPDGYHNLVSIMVPVDLFDRLEIRLIPEGVTFSCTGLAVPSDETNLVVKAARSFFSRVGKAYGASILLEKRIPLSAGMGGGSSDAASLLLLLNEALGNPVSQEELHETALSLGADVPFFLACKPAIARGIGEILDPISDWPEFRYVIVTPRIQVSTAWVYENLRLKELTRNEYSHIKTLLRENPEAVTRILENDLESVTSARFPVIETIKHLLLDSGAVGALMTGSGPSVFGVFSSSGQAEAAKNHILSRNMGDVFLVRKWERESIIQ